MTTRYHVLYDGPDTEITEHPQGTWPRWEMAQRAAFEHLREHVRECQETIMCFRRAASFGEYMVLRGEGEEGHTQEVGEGGHG